MTEGPTDGVDPATVPLLPATVGERLRAARIAAGLDLGDVASRTRVPQRHLDAIERSDYPALPSATYAIGFARSFARVVGIDERRISEDLRGELGRTSPPPAEQAVRYEPVDATQVPSRLLAWTAAAILVVLVAGYIAWRSALFDGSPPPTPVVAEAPPAAAPVVAKPATPPATGQVVLTATQPVWLRIYDRDRKRLFEKELAIGESYTVPREAADPMILTGRPEALTVTIDGQPVAALGTARAAIKDVGISAAALLARSGVATASPPPSTPRPLSGGATLSPVGDRAPGSSAPGNSANIAPSPVAAPPPVGNNNIAP